MDANELSVTGTLRAMAAGELTAEGLMEACLARVGAREETVHAFAHMDEDAALAGARAADAAGRPGPLGGIPVGLKDIIDTADMPTEYNSVIYKGHRPEKDAACATALKAAGAVVAGKTNTTTFAHRNVSPARNPHNPAHTPGGSSSGSGAAVGDRMVPLALGTQTGGSVLRPGAYCGTVAYKPAFGAIDFTGTKQIALALDTLGFYTRSLDDLPLVGGVLEGKPGPLAVGDDTAAPKIALVRTSSWDKAEPEGHGIVETVFGKLAAAGATVREVDLPSPYPEMFDAHSIVGNTGAVECLAWEIENHWDGIPTVTQKMIRAGQRAGPGAMEEALAVGAAGRAKLPCLFAADEIILTLSAAGEAPEGIAKTGTAEFNRLWTFLHVPCLQIPVDKGPRGLPLGVQLVSLTGSEPHLFAAARWAARKLGLDLFG